MLRRLGSIPFLILLATVLCVGFPPGCGGGGGGDDGGGDVGGGADYCLGAEPAYVSVSSGGTSMTPDELYLAEMVFHYTNAERVVRGESALVWDDELAEVAYRHSQWQRDVNGALTHDGPNGCTDQCLVYRLQLYGGLTQGIDYGWAGENVAEGQTTVDMVMCSQWGWMQSPGHFDNIVREQFTTLGVGVAWGSPGPMWTQVFTGPP